MDPLDPTVPVVPPVVPAKATIPISESARRSVLIAAILASSMGFIDGSVVALAVPAIRDDLGATLVDAQWINNAYLLFLAALVLIGGSAGDVFGARRVFALGIGLFMATSLACAVAPDPKTLILMRGAQGMGAALMVPGSLSIIAKTYPPHLRGAAIGTWAAFSSLTMAVGPVLGGMLLSFGETWMWRLIFAINVPMGLVALYLLLRRVPADRPSSRRSLDWTGAVLATLGLGLVAWGLTEYGVRPGERLMPPLPTFGAGIAALALFVGWERIARQPMVRLGLFREGAFAGANVYTLVLFLAFNAVLFFLPMTLITAWSVTEWQVSATLLPLALFIAVLSGPAGRLADRIGPRLPLTVGGIVIGVAFFALAATIDRMDLWLTTFPILLLFGLGMATLVSPLSAAVMLAAPDEEAGLASGVNNAVARVAGLIAIAGLGALANVVFARALGPSAGLDFGAPETALSADAIAAANTAFSAIAAVAGALCMLSALIAWVTQPSWPAGSRAPTPADGSAARDLQGV